MRILKVLFLIVIVSCIAFCGKVDQDQQQITKSDLIIDFEPKQEDKARIICNEGESESNIINVTVANSGEETLKYEISNKPEWLITMHDDGSILPNESELFNFRADCRELEGSPKAILADFEIINTDNVKDFDRIQLELFVIPSKTTIVDGPPEIKYLESVYTPMPYFYVCMDFIVEFNEDLFTLPSVEFYVKYGDLILDMYSLSLEPAFLNSSRFYYLRDKYCHKEDDPIYNDTENHLELHISGAADYWGEVMEDYEHIIEID